MARRNISLPDEIDALAREAGLNVSFICAGAILAELDRRKRMAALESWLDDLDEQRGVPSARVSADASRWARSARPVRERLRNLEGVSAVR